MKITSQGRSMTLTVAIMTFNRPWYLQNCWNSVRTCLPDAQILVVDDKSDDPKQIDVLLMMEHDKKTRILRQPEDIQKYHGNLYDNMQWALNVVDTEYLMYLQDDTQIVRPVDATDLRSFQDFFAQSSNLAFIHPFFFKWRKRQQWRHKLRAEPDLRVYRSAGSRSAFHYSDICVTHVARLRAVGWIFKLSEKENIAQAASLFGGMGMMVDPIGFFCPQVPSFRDRSLSHSAAARLSRQRIPEVFRYEFLTATQTNALRARPARTLPIAEDTLKTIPPTSRRPFVFQDYKATFHLHFLHHIERLIRKLGVLRR